MTETSNSNNAKLTGGIVGAVVAVVLIVMGMVVVGIIAGVVVGVVLAAVIGKKAVGAAPAQEEASVAEPVAAEATPGVQEEAAPATQVTTGEEPKWKPSATLPGQEDLASRKGSWRYQGG